MKSVPDRTAREPIRDCNLPGSGHHSSRKGDHGTTRDLQAPPDDPLASELMILWNRYVGSWDESIAREMWDLVKPLLDAPTPEGA